MSELVADVRNAINEIRTALSQYRSQIDKLLQGNITINFNLKPAYKLVIALLLAFLFGIILALIYNRTRCPSPLAIFILMALVAIFIYWIL
jgi:hypothetical protein